MKTVLVTLSDTDQETWLTPNYSEEVVAPPEGMVFDGFDVNGTRVAEATAVQSLLTANTDIKYLWKDSPKPQLTIKVNDQTYTYNGSTQGEGDTVYEDSEMIAQKVTIEGDLQDGDVLASIIIDGQGKDIGEYELVPSNVVIKNGDNVVTDNYDIKLVSGKLTIAQEYNIEVITEGSGSASASPVSGITSTEVTLKATPENGWQFKEWEVVSGDVIVENDKFTIGMEDVKIKAVFEEIPATATIYTVTIEPGDGTGNPIVYHSNEGTIGDSWRTASDFQFYTEDNGQMGFKLDTNNCPDGLKPPEGYVFDGYENGVTFNTLSKTETTFIVSWKPGASLLPDASYTLEPSEYTITDSGYTDIECYISSIELGKVKDENGQFHRTQWIEFYSNAGELIDGDGHSISFWVENSGKHEEPKERAYCDIAQTPWSAITMVVYINPDDFSTAIPGTYTGMLRYETEWLIDTYEYIPGEPGQIALTLVISPPEASATSPANNQSDKTSQQPDQPPHITHDDCDWQMTREATPQVDGEMVYVCNTCSAVLQRIVLTGFVPFNEEAAAKIRNARYGEEVVIITDKWISFYSPVWDELAKRPDVALTIDYRYQGHAYEVKVPAGADVQSMKNYEGYIGFLYLSGKFGRQEIKVY